MANWCVAEMVRVCSGLKCVGSGCGHVTSGKRESDSAFLVFTMSVRRLFVTSRLPYCYKLVATFPCLVKVTTQTKEIMISRRLLYKTKDVYVKFLRLSLKLFYLDFSVNSSVRKSIRILSISNGDWLVS